MKLLTRWLACGIVFLVCALPESAGAQTGSVTKKRAVAYPEVPRISAYQAYLKYQAGQAILVHAGGESYEKRHIVGALKLRSEDVRKGRVKMPNFPRKGVLIITYCY